MCLPCMAGREMIRLDDGDRNQQHAMHILLRTTQPSAQLELEDCMLIDNRDATSASGVMLPKGDFSCRFVDRPAEGSARRMDCRDGGWMEGRMAGADASQRLAGCRIIMLTPSCHYCLPSVHNPILCGPSFIHSFCLSVCLPCLPVSPPNSENNCRCGAWLVGWGSMRNHDCANAKPG
ncbi:hypothetical protein BO71DRAFT_181450 [Aspergillus ellipticus CBS 707.79]|uniref:Uncharacterized protein n=1 Tax=Aspergillus ellipticus CBS 707.79 TaxID=1448320 RepID=A0A319DG75_9EURO|nr:hypothetical protein BO71DRAFT_181450 [Aspergillus ellipticus CBS 707.79]